VCASVSFLYVYVCGYTEVALCLVFYVKKEIKYMYIFNNDDIYIYTMGWG